MHIITTKVAMITGKIQHIIIIKTTIFHLPVIQLIYIHVTYRWHKNGDHGSKHGHHSAGHKGGHHSYGSNNHGHHGHSKHGGDDSSYKHGKHGSHHSSKGENTKQSNKEMLLHLQ